MTTTHSRKKPVSHASKKRLAIIGYLFLSPPVVFSLRWLSTNSSLSPAGRINDFQEGLPGALQHFHLLVTLSLLCCIVSLVLVSRSFNQPAVFLRVFDIIAAMLAAVIGFMNIFQLI